MRLEEGHVIYARPENVTQMCVVSLQGLASRASLNGQQGQVVGFSNGRYLVLLATKGQEVLSLQPSNVILKPGTRVRLQGLRESSLNGLRGEISQVDLEGKRYQVTLAKKQVKVKFENAFC